MFSIGKINIEKALLLAPMEDVTDISFRLVCRELGADVVYTEFVNAEGLVRASKKTHAKLRILNEERPVGIQIYGGNTESMINAARIAETENPDIIDINAGCWVKGVVKCGAGAGLLKDPVHLQNLVKQVVNAVSIPVTVKTRIGWDENSIEVLDVAKRLEDAGAHGIVIHCRTRSQGHSGDADWSWIPKIKEVVKIPVALNGGVMTPFDAVRAFDETGADAVMIARGAIANPWIFREVKELLQFGEIKTPVNNEIKIKACFRHLELAVGVKGDRRAILEHRKFYSGYLKGMRNASSVRVKLMQTIDINEIKGILFQFLEELSSSE